MTYFCAKWLNFVADAKKDMYNEIINLEEKTWDFLAQTY